VDHLAGGTAADGALAVLLLNADLGVFGMA